MDMLKEDNRGVSLLELIVALLIVAIIGSGIAIAAVAKIKESRNNRNDTVKRMFVDRCEAVNASYNFKKLNNSTAVSVSENGFCAILSSDGTVSFIFDASAERSLASAESEAIVSVFGNWDVQYDGDVVKYSLSHNKIVE